MSPSVPTGTEEGPTMPRPHPQHAAGSINAFVIPSATLHCNLTRGEFTRRYVKPPPLGHTDPLYSLQVHSLDLGLPLAIALQNQYMSGQYHICCDIIGLGSLVPYITSDESRVSDSLSDLPPLSRLCDV